MTASLTIEREFSARPARVWRAWTNPENLGQWISGHARAVFEPQPGGRVEVDMPDERGSHLHTGEVLAVDAPERIAFTWRSEATGDHTTRIELRLERIQGGCRLTLVHSELPDAASADDHRQGWNEMLDVLAEYLSL